MLLLGAHAQTSTVNDSLSTTPSPFDGDDNQTTTGDASAGSEFNTPLAVILAIQLLQLVFQVLINVRAGSFGKPPAICRSAAADNLELGAEILSRLEKSLKETQDKNDALLDLLVQLSSDPALKSIKVQ